MAIVTISRIQNRRGLIENLPQLAAAELGWALDQRRLFIGNGPTEEGAPAVGNTEILTEYSDILSTAQNYTFKNSNTPFVPTTGPSSTSPIVRTMQNKFDDVVSVLDFGAKGDGATDDTAAINRALYQLYCAEQFQDVKRALHFPAGVYIVTDYVKVPPNATLLGEGPTNTIIKQMGDPNTVTAVMQTADSLQQIGGSIGTNAVLPADIHIADIGLVCNLDGIYIASCNRITLNRVNITGPDSFPRTVLSSTTLDVPVASKGVYITGTAIQPSQDINLLDCFINKFTYGIWQDNANEFFQNIIITSATFQELYEGIYLAVNNGTVKNMTVTSSVFNNIYGPAIDLGNVDNFASSFNYYQEVGTAYLGAGSPATNVISFGTLTNHSASLGDLFDRPDSDDYFYPRVAGNTNTSYFQYGHVLTIGYLAKQAGFDATLTDATTGGSTGLVMPLNRYRHARIIYSLFRGGDNRSGVLNVSFHGSGYSIDDDSTETADLGVVFDISSGGTNATLTYTTTSTGYAADFRYSVERLTDVV